MKIKVALAGAYGNLGSDIFKELIKKPRFIFSKLCTAKKYTRLETVTAFSGILELTRRNKIRAQQEKNFADIIVEKASK